MSISIAPSTIEIPVMNMKTLILTLFVFGLLGIACAVAAGPDTALDEPLSSRYFGREFKTGEIFAKEKAENVQPIEKIDYLELPDDVPPEVKRLIDLTNEIIGKVNERKLQSMNAWFEEKILSDPPEFNRGFQFISFTPTLSVAANRTTPNRLIIEIDGAGKFLDKDEEGREVVMSTNSRFLGSFRTFPGQRYPIITIIANEGKVVSIYPYYLNREAEVWMKWVGDRNRIVYRAFNDNPRVRAPLKPYPWITWSINGELLENTTRSLQRQTIGTWGGTTPSVYDENGQLIPLW